MKYIVKKEKKVYVSEQLAKCESLGGRYQLRYSNAYEEYYESCYVTSREISLEDNQ